MTKFKYENRGGRGFNTFHPFSNLEPTIHNKKKKENKPSKNELLFKDVIEEGEKMKNSQWTRKDLNYKKIKLGFAIKILLKLVYNKEIRTILRRIKKEDLLYHKVKRKVESNYRIFLQQD